MADYSMILYPSVVGPAERGQAALTRSFVGIECTQRTQTAIPPRRHALPMRKSLLTPYFNMCLIICHCL